MARERGENPNVVNRLLDCGERYKKNLSDKQNGVSYSFQPAFEEPTEDFTPKIGVSTMKRDQNKITDQEFHQVNQENHQNPQL